MSGDTWPPPEGRVGPGFLLFAALRGERPVVPAGRRRLQPENQARAGLVLSATLVKASGSVPSMIKAPTFRLRDGPGKGAASRWSRTNPAGTGCDAFKSGENMRVRLARATRPSYASGNWICPMEEPAAASAD